MGAVDVEFLSAGRTDLAVPASASTTGDSNCVHPNRRGRYHVGDVVQCVRNYNASFGSDGTYEGLVLGASGIRLNRGAFEPAHLPPFLFIAT